MYFLFNDDTHATGVVMWEVYAQRDPAALLPSDATGRALSVSVQQGQRLPLPVTCPARVITACWHADPNQRPTFAAMDGLLVSPN